MAELLDRWRSLLDAEQAFDLTAAGNVASAIGRGVTIVELIEHAALCGRPDTLAQLLDLPAEDPAATGPRALFDLIAAYEAGRRLLDTDALRGHTRDRLIASLEQSPGLIGCRAYDGKTLLHVAAGAHDDRLVHDLLRLGADAAAADDLGRTALFSAANRVIEPGRRTPTDGYEAVRAVIAAGADPDRPGGEGRQTPLHLAARRGNVGVAAALLDGGAAIDPPDALGATPQRRAINCRQRAVAALLSARGAVDDRTSPAP
jgi:hypothetical protein